MMLRKSAIAGLLLFSVALLAASVLSAQQGVVVSVDAPASVDPGDTFTVRVDVSQITDFAAGEFKTSFDPGVLTIDDVTAGGDITDGVIGGTTIPLLTPNQISTGLIKVTMNVPGIAGVSGLGYLAELTFRAIGAGGTSSTIDLIDILLVDKNESVMPTTAVGATVAIGGPTPTPTPTPTATATPVGAIPTATPTPTTLPAGSVVGVGSIKRGLGGYLHRAGEHPRCDELRSG